MSAAVNLLQVLVLVFYFPRKSGASQRLRENGLNWRHANIAGLWRKCHLKRTIPRQRVGAESEMGQLNFLNWYESELLNSLIHFVAPSGFNLHRNYNVFQIYSEHAGEYRQAGDRIDIRGKRLAPSKLWCSLQSSPEGAICAHGGGLLGILAQPHWSCCGALEFNSRCLKLGMTSVSAPSKVLLTIYPSIFCPSNGDIIAH